MQTFQMHVPMLNDIIFTSWEKSLNYNVALFSLCLDKTAPFLPPFVLDDYRSCHGFFQTFVQIVIGVPL